MPIHTHRQQRKGHLVRYGPVHFIQHVRHTPHAHHRALPKPGNRGRNRVIAVLVGCGLVIVAAIVLVLFLKGPVDTARADLAAARNLITSDLGNKSLLTTAAGRAQLSQDIGTVSEDAAKADAALQGSASLRILGVLPVLSTQRQGLLQLSSDTEKAAAAGGAIVASLQNLVAHSHGTVVSLPDLAQLEFMVTAGHKDLAALDRPSGGLLGPIASARLAFDREDAKLLRLLSLSARTIAFARPFLGADGPQTYLIGGQNNAEMRDSGSVLSLDLLTADNGAFSIQRDTTYGNYELSAPAPVNLPAGTVRVFGAYLPTEQWPDVDATADFALSGESMQGMWAEATGQTVNGVIGIDVPGVASILHLTGPVEVPGLAGEVSAANVADVLLNKAYAGDTVNDPQNARRDQIAAVVKAAVDRMQEEHVDLDALATALSDDVQGRHLMVWSDVPGDESLLDSLDAAGTLTAALPDRTFHVAVENSTADKLDYFVSVGVTLHVTIDPSGNAVINTSVAVANHALPGQPPSYQYGPDGINAFTPGQYVARVFLWGPRGAIVPDSTAESGLEVTQSHFSLLPGQHGGVTFATVIRHAVVKGHLQLRLVPQARLVPDHLTIDLSAPGWGISGPTHIATSWSHTMTLRWGLSG